MKGRAIFFTMDSIFKSEHPRSFTAVENDFIRDKRLSWKAKGIIIYAMSLPVGTRLNVQELCDHAKDGRDATYNGINELIKYGYCSRYVIRGGDGRYKCNEYWISDKVLEQTIK